MLENRPTFPSESGHRKEPQIHKLVVLERKTHDWKDDAVPVLAPFEAESQCRKG